MGYALTSCIKGVWHTMAKMAHMELLSCNQIAKRIWKATNQPKSNSIIVLTQYSYVEFGIWKAAVSSRVFSQLECLRASMRNCVIPIFCRRSISDGCVRKPLLPSSYACRLLVIANNISQIHSILNISLQHQSRPFYIIESQQFPTLPHQSIVQNASHWTRLHPS